MLEEMWCLYGLYLEIYTEGRAPSSVPDCIRCLAHTLRTSCQHYIGFSQFDLLQNNAIAIITANYVSIKNEAILQFIYQYNV